MKLRTARLFVAGGAFALGLVLLATAFALVGFRSFDGGSPGIASIGGPFRLVDGDGHTVTDENFKGKPFLVFFGYTHCPDVCPTTLFEISQLFRKLGPDADRARALFITVDPERDTPKIMKDYLSNFDRHIVGLTGDPAQIAQVAKVYRVYFKKEPLPEGGYAMDHSAIIYLMDRNGRFVAPFNLKRTAEAAAADLRKRL